jgi:hypothetical protein
LFQSGPGRHGRRRRQSLDVVPPANGVLFWRHVGRQSIVQPAVVVGLIEAEVAGLTLAEEPRDAGLSLVGTTVVGIGSTPLDNTVSRDQDFMYVLLGGFHQIVGCRIGHAGNLTQVTSVAVPVGAAGIVANLLRTRGIGERGCCARFGASAHVQHSGVASGSCAF